VVLEIVIRQYRHLDQLEQRLDERQRVERQLGEPPHEGVLPVGLLVLLIRQPSTWDVQVAA
jgi:hypothetical protein